MFPSSRYGICCCTQPVVYMQGGLLSSKQLQWCCGRSWAPRIPVMCRFSFFFILFFVLFYFLFSELIISVFMLWRGADGQLLGAVQQEQHVGHG